MILHQRQKVENALAYFAFEFYKINKYYPSQTWIYKALALLDFMVLRRQGVPCIGSDYDAMELGPVPPAFYFAVRKAAPIEGEKYRFVLSPSGKRRVSVENTADPDLDYFSDLELEVMDFILDEYSTQGIEAIIHAAHRDIRAWRVAWAKAQACGQARLPMEYSDEFEGLEDKSFDELTPEEDRFLCHKGLVESENLLEEAVY